jgi:hypothetical protein
VHELGRDQSKTTKEMLDNVTRHASGEEAVGDIFVQGDGRAVPTSSRGASPKDTDKGAKRSAKGSRRGPKWCPQWIAVATNCDEDNNDKEAANSDMEHVATTERDFKHQAW